MNAARQLTMALEPEPVVRSPPPVDPVQGRTNAMDDLHGIKPLRALHYIGANFGITGIETFVMHLCEAQKRIGLVPSVMMDISGREELSGIARDRGVAIHDMPIQSGLELRLPRKLSAVLVRRSRIAKLVSLLRKADVLHIHEGMFAIDAFLAARIAGFRRIVVTHHGSMAFHKSNWSRQRAFAFWQEKRWASQVVVPYRALAEEYIEQGVPEDRISVVPYCVDDRAFVGVAAEPNLGELTLLIASRMVPGKGHAELVHAVARLAPRYPKILLLIAGDGPTRPDIEAEVERLKLQQNVKFTGHVDFREMPDLLRRAHVIALPSYMWGETFPLCLLEGMAMGLPAIGTRWFGIPDIIEDGENGLLVEPRDVDMLAHAIARFLTEPGFYPRVQRSAIARFNERYAATAIATAYMKLYSKSEPLES
jgi:glycosyltransferase involved in cell wall biosynthesis